MTKTVIVTGSQGFIGTYLCRELLKAGYKVVGFDNFSKYGKVKRPHDSHSNFLLEELDLTAQVPDFHKYNPTYVILGAALIGGIATFSTYAFDLIMQNELILANSYKAILSTNKPERVVTISSSMVYEGADVEFDKLEWLASSNCCGYGNFPILPEKHVWPTKENQLDDLPPPCSTYGMQKLMSEFWAIGAAKQYGIPYTIVRPFNCVGAYEEPSIFDVDVMSGNVKMLMSHVLPDLVHKCLEGQNPLHLLGDGSQIRCYTHGRDIARGIRLAMESPRVNQAYNISAAQPTTVLELARLVWEIINPNREFKVQYDEPYQWDVQKRLPDVTKAREELGFEATISLEESVIEVIEYMREMRKND